MSIRIKDWTKFQHFKDRTPPWVKLYRELLDDPDWHELDGESGKTLVMLWLIASEDESHNGTLPDLRRLAFRLRTTEVKLKQQLTKLSHWLVDDDITAISPRYHDDAPERETEAYSEETKTETELSSKFSVSEFDKFWNSYPRKAGKGAALKAWKTAIKKTSPESLLAAVTAHGEHWRTEKTESEFIPHPATWLNGERWSDSLEKPKKFDVKAYMAELEERENVGS